MPGRRRQDQGSSGLITNYISANARTPSTKSTAAECTRPSTMPTRVTFIPAQRDAHAGSTAKALRESPAFGLIRDTRVLMGMLHYMPLIVSPFSTTDETAELYPWSWLNIRDAVLQSLLAIIQALMILLAPVAILLSAVVPGALLVAMIAVPCAIVYVIALPMQGPRIVYEQPRMDLNRHPDERWLFVNGCLTGHVGLQQNVNRLSKTFGRPVTGIHNQSYGLFSDLIECLVQRCWSYNTQDSRIAYEQVKANLIDTAVKKVVLIGHSQGGIIASLVVDRLLADLPIETVSKLEVYTFGSAASHFNNPRLTLKPKSSPPGNETTFSNPPSDHVIPHIEHYCNERDMVPKWGVLYSVEKILARRYSGKVFVRKGASGHLFNQHYMDPMFPLAHGGKPTTFLNQVVDVDEAKARKREAAAVECSRLARVDSGMVPAAKEESVMSPVAFGNGESVSERLIEGEEEAADPSISFVEGGWQAAVWARGKTVAELSRLWRYIDGNTPGAAEGETSGVNGC